MSRSGVSGGAVLLSQADEPLYEKGDRVWVLSGDGLHLPGLVIGYHADWDLYRVVYMGNIAERNPSVVQEWRLSPRRAKRESPLDVPVDEFSGRPASSYNR